MDWKKKELIWSQPRPAQAANEDWNEVSRHLAYTLNNNLYVMTNEMTGTTIGTMSVNRCL